MEFLTQLVENIGGWGYLVLFLGLVLEGEGIVLAFAFLTRLGFFNFYLILPFIFLVEVIGDSFWYWLGRGWGEKIIILFFSRERFAKIKSHFHNGGGKTVFISKFVYSMNKITMITAGSTKMGYKKFISYDLAAVLIWTLLFFTLGYLFGHSFVLLKKYVTGAEQILLIILVIFVAIRYLIGRRVKSKVE